jgi:signal transduction histidine kinase/ActR/RegA family two-component response regulator
MPFLPHPKRLSLFHRELPAQPGEQKRAETGTDPAGLELKERQRHVLHRFSDSPNMTPNDSAVEMPGDLCEGAPISPSPWLSSVGTALAAFVRKQWPTIIAVSLGCLVVLDLVVDANRGRVKEIANSASNGGSSGSAAIEADARLQEVITTLAQTEGANTERTSGLIRASVDMDDLLAAEMKLPRSRGRGASILKLRQAVAGIVRTFGISSAGKESGGAGRFMEDVDRFKAELTAFGSSPQDREFVSDASQKLMALIALGEDLDSTRSGRAAALDKLAGIREEIKKTGDGIEIRSAPQQGPQGPLWNPLHFSLTLMLWALTFVAGAVIIYGKIVTQRAQRSIVRPVAHVVKIAQSITSGKTRSRISAQAMGDLHELAEAFNQIIDALQMTEARSQTAHTSLELKVGARTAELWKANKALREESELRLRAERDFQQAQKMDALGKLAGSIAHDFNNILTVIIGGAEYVRTKMGADHEAGSMLRTIEQAGERAAGLTRQMLTFSRNEVLSVETVNLNEASNEAGRMLQRLLGLNIELRLELSAEARPIRANANQIQQVLINLAINARDAMEGIGILTIATRNPEMDPELARRNGVAMREGWVELAVRDTGCGMDAATQARIFEPFFTTKPKGKGTGFGLATVFGIVRQNGGFIDVESALGEGSVFRVFLPAVEPEAEANVCIVEAQSETREFGGGETLLLVDDEEDIRELATMTLEGNGYRVLSVPNAEQAIVLAEKHPGEIQALITDVVMPGMTGVQLATILTKLIPDLNVLFVSGHSNESITEDTLQATRGDYLQKPYLGKTLVSKVQDLLKRRKEAAVSRM